jgi:hypothetical protein
MVGTSVLHARDFEASVARPQAEVDVLKREEVRFVE